MSELRKQQRANPGVKQWFASVAGDSLYLSVLVIGEIRNGIERLRRRDPIAANNLEAWLLRIETEMAERILPVTSNIADRWGRLIPPTLCLLLILCWPQPHWNMILFW
ncbi:MAG: hypothetical protein ACKN9F_05690 [Methylomonas sp.]